MANPQLEDGYTKIANEVLEHIACAPIGSAEWACIAVVIRQTWGWGKKEAEIALKQFVGATARPVGSVRHALVNLQKKRIIAQVTPPAFDRAATWMLNKDWESWKVGEGIKKDTPPQKGHSLSKRADSLKKDTPQSPKKDTPPSLKKDTPPKKNRPERSQNQPSAPARKLQKENIKKIKEKKVGEKAADPRWKPLVDFFFEQFRIFRGYKLTPHAADFNGLRILLQRTRGDPDFETCRLQECMLRFLGSSDPFHQKQGKPLAYFCANINAFQARAAPEVKRKQQDGSAARANYAAALRGKKGLNAEESEWLRLYDAGKIA